MKRRQIHLRQSPLLGPTTPEEKSRKQPAKACRACKAYGQEDHTCERLRPMTDAEKELVEAALLFTYRHSDGRGCSVLLDPDNCGSSERIIKAAGTVRAERQSKEPT